MCNSLCELALAPLVIQWSTYLYADIYMNNHHGVSDSWKHWLIWLFYYIGNSNTMNSFTDGDVIFWHEEFLVKFWTKYTFLSIYTIEAFFKNSVDIQKCKGHSNTRYFVFTHKMELHRYNQAFHLRECLAGHGKFQGTQSNSLLHGTFLHPAGHLPPVTTTWWQPRNTPQISKMPTTGWHHPLWEPLQLDMCL